MALRYLHDHKNFSELIQIVAQRESIDPSLVEKDYWIMHCLYGLQQSNMQFELKGGTSLSKGYKLIHRFSEDIDIRIHPPAVMDVPIGRNQDKPAHCKKREGFYDWLAQNIQINGIKSVTRDTTFDDKKFRSGGIRLHYPTTLTQLAGVKDGILLEVGFDDITPHFPRDISSWAYDFGSTKVSVIDNRAKAVACYHPGYTFVEKLQAISTKYRKRLEEGRFPENFMRHYYDIYCLLQDQQVLNFINSAEYNAHKEKRFSKDDEKVISKNEAFLLSNEGIKNTFKKQYKATQALYYKGQVDFDEILASIRAHIARL
jgi:hypothetical protein